jgi:tetratricopeptide (TPR) repeat protein/predicted Ser/Thr protein kinase
MEKSRQPRGRRLFYLVHHLVASWRAAKSPTITVKVIDDADTLTSSEVMGETNSTLPLRSTLTLQPGSSDGDVVPGTLIARFVVLSKLGAGAMGVVLAAYDPELDRKVAIKLLKTRRGPQDAARARLRREAQALAKLHHPHVVSVYDVGIHDGQVFVGMEFVKGQTLRSWMADVERPRAWPEILGVFAQAGRGLAAAHAAGLTHRDFKPDNVMLGMDGRVRVMDFGLAQVEDDEMSEPVLERLRQRSGERSPVGLTQTGTIMGTPAYMPLEQFEARDADARSDQFSFCVALYEALYGERPFAGETLAALIEAVKADRVREATSASKVPVWLRRVVVRGLAAKPDARWPSMEALLDALADDPALRRRKWWVASIAAGLICGGVWGGSVALRSDTPACSDMQAKLDGVWDADRRAAVQTAIEATQLSYAPGTWARVEPLLDVYTRQWVQARVDACEATQRGEQSDELLDLRMACLDERLSHVHTTVDLLASADAEVVENAVDAVAGLPSLDRCADAAALMAAQPPPDDDDAQRVAELDQRLIEVDALVKVGKYRDALTIADAVVREAARIDYAPLRARAWLAEGTLRLRLGEYEPAEATLERAYEAAVELDMDVEAASASAQLLVVLGTKLDRHDDARQWAKHAKPLARAVGTDEAWAVYRSNLGLVARQEGNYAEARACHEEALAIHERAFGPNDTSVALSLIRLGIVAKVEGNYEAALGLQTRALTIYEQVLGPEHPQVANVLNNLGVLAQVGGDFDDARDYHERALAIEQRALGLEHPDLAGTLSDLGIVAFERGDYAEARRHQERALAIVEAALGPDNFKATYALNSLGIIAEVEGKYEEARAHHERALAIKEKVLGPDHIQVALTLDNLGTLALVERNYPLARRHHERALAIYVPVLGPDHPDLAHALNNLATVAYEQGDYAAAHDGFLRSLAVLEHGLDPAHPLAAYPLTGLGRTLIADGKPADAIVHLERALAIRTSSELIPTDLAETRFVLAQALWSAPADAGGDRPRAIELAERARETHADNGPASAGHLDAVQTWLAAR